jgi:hypothetical protein
MGPADPASLTFHPTLVVGTVDPGLGLRQADAVYEAEQDAFLPVLAAPR